MPDPRRLIGEAVADVLLFRAGAPLTEGKWSAPFKSILSSLEREVGRFMALLPKVDEVHPKVAEALWHELGEKSIAVHQLYAELEQRVREAERGAY